MPWKKIVVWFFCLPLLACCLLPLACGDDDDDDDDDDGEETEEPEVVTAQDCADAMIRLFGEEGCANVSGEAQYTDEEIQGSCDQDFSVSEKSECHTAAFEEMVACMEGINCADASESYYAWTECRIDFDTAINICECPPDGIC